MATVGGVASAIFILFFLLSIYGLSRGKDPGFYRLSSVDKLGLASLLGFVLVILLGYANAIDTQQYWSRFERVLRAFGCVVIFLYLLGRDIKLILVFERGVLVGALLVFVVASLQMGSLERAQGAYNAILFGDFSAYLACAAAVAAFTHRDRTMWAVAFFAAMLLSGYACILSGTRGGWIGLFGGLSFVLVVWLSTQSRRIGFVGTTALTSISLASIAWLLSLHPIVRPRLSLAVRETAQFFSEGDSNTSIGYRFQMWAAAYDMWLKNPVLGSGLGDYSYDLAEMIRLGDSSMNAHFGEAHSLYFEFLATTGLVGFVMLLLCMFVVPVIVFMGWHRSGGVANLLNSPAALHGVCLVIVFSSFGISQNWLGRSSISSVFFLCLSLFWVAVVRERKNSAHPDEFRGA